MDVVPAELFKYEQNTSNLPETSINEGGGRPNWELSMLSSERKINNSIFT